MEITIPSASVFIYKIHLEFTVCFQSYLGENTRSFCTEDQSALKIVPQLDFLRIKTALFAFLRSRG